LRFLTVVMMLAATPVWADAQGDALALVNKARAGCAALVVNPQLQAAAERHATAMAQQNFFSHTGADGSKMQGRIQAQGYNGRKLAENIAAGQPTAQDVVAGWLKSAGHKRNMLDCDFTETGLALVDQPDDKPLAGNAAAYRYYWVQVFARR
jgi:uncharacterized protein YkwD